MRAGITFWQKTLFALCHKAMPNIALARTDRCICPSSASDTQSVTKGSEVGLVVVISVETSLIDRIQRHFLET